MVSLLTLTSGQFDEVIRSFASIQVIKHDVTKKASSEFQEDRNEIFQEIEKNWFLDLQ